MIASKLNLLVYYLLLHAHIFIFYANTFPQRELFAQFVKLCN